MQNSEKKASEQKEGEQFSSAQFEKALGGLLMKLCLKEEKQRIAGMLKGATSRITQLEKAGKFFQVCHS